MTEEPDKPWVAHGSEWAEHEDFLIGNRSGLLRLREAIDQAVVDGLSKIEDGHIEFMGVKTVEKDPRKFPGNPSSGAPFAFFMICLLLAVIVLICLGVWKLTELIG